MSSVDLSVIIPAWKAEFLSAALESMALQTDSRFHVYIGDDKSSDNIERIVDNYREKLDLTYHRFDTHLGSVSLVQHWNRCVRLGSENWVWLFSDDDIADSDCVQKFHEALALTQSVYDVYRFNSVSIDEEGCVMSIHPPHPDFETSLDFIYHTLTYQRTSPVPEYIFSRNTFEECGGLVDFPMAWCSDHASVAAFSARTGIKTINGPFVRWRRSNLHVTALHDELTALKKLKAAMEYCAWLRGKYNLQSCTLLTDRISPECLQRATDEWVLTQWRQYAHWCSILEVEKLLPNFARISGLQESLLQSSVSEAFYGESLKRFPRLSAFPKKLISRYPRLASLLETLLLIGAFVINSKTVTDLVGNGHSQK